jgi:hypothetical protein
MTVVILLVYRLMTVLILLVYRLTPAEGHDTAARYYRRRHLSSASTGFQLCTALGLLKPHLVKVAEGHTCVRFTI